MDLPIWLKVGTSAYGATHILTKHRRWISDQGLEPAAVIYEKLGQRGRMYTTESGAKIKLALRINPAALILLEYIRYD